MAAATAVALHCFGGHLERGSSASRGLRSVSISAARKCSLSSSAPAGEIEAVEKLAIPADAGDRRCHCHRACRGCRRRRRCRGPATLPLGVGCPGMVDREGVAHFCPNLHAFDGIDLRHELARRRPEAATTVVVNDATAACWAEHAIGAGKGSDDVLMVTLGTGIGGGAVLGGRLVEGAHGFAGEIGHMVIDPQAHRAHVGKRAAGSASPRGAPWAGWGGKRLKRGSSTPLSGSREATRRQCAGEHVTTAALDGDPEALEVMATFAWWMALGLANLANALDPSVIVLGGGVIQAERAFMGRIRDAFAELAEAPGARKVEILPAHFGERAGAVGAGLLAVRRGWRRITFASRSTRPASL